MARDGNPVAEALVHSIRAPWALSVDLAPLVVSLVADHARGHDIPLARIAAALGPDDIRPRAARDRPVNLLPAGRGGKSVAVVPVYGIATYSLEYFPYAFSTLGLARTMAALAADAAVASIVLDIASPGGTVTGTPEAADAIRAAAATKPVTAIANPLAASAGYWLASQASRLVVTPSGDVGSIGVYMLHVDLSGALDKAGIKPTFIFAGSRKVDGNPYEPLSDRARREWQSDCDSIFDAFVSAVARGRATPRHKVRADFGQGRTFMAAEAHRLGMVDQVATPDQAVAAALAAGTRRASAGDDMTRRFLQRALSSKDPVTRSRYFKLAAAAAA